MADEDALGVVQAAGGWGGPGEAVRGGRPRGGQATAGLGGAEEDVGEGIAEFLAGEPGEEDGRDAAGPGEEDGGAGVDHDDGVGVGGGDRADQVVLAAGERQGVAVEAFALDLAGYDNISIGALGPVSLTSVDQDGRLLGSNAARLLLERIQGGRQRSVLLSLTPSLVPRRSTTPPPPADHPSRTR